MENRRDRDRVTIRTTPHQCSELQWERIVLWDWKQIYLSWGTEIKVVV